jgi:stearoyl-CoA desaturase (delta-9 desaturase)
MSKLERYLNLTAVVLPFVAFLAAVVLLWESLVGPADLAILAGMYLVTAIGVTVGYHRMFTHRAFDAPRPVKYTLAVLGSMAVQGSLIDWVADHRKHHAFTDEDGDPHSPHGHGGGIKGALHGLWHAHMGWLLDTQGAAEKRRYAKDLLEDRGMRKISRKFPQIVLAGLAIPAVLGFVLTGTLLGALTGLLWGGFVRIFMVHHVTWSINSVCHFFGRRRFDLEDQSTNVFWLALPSLGESWHHNHHAFPRSAAHGLRWWEIDVSALIIRGMEKVGLAYNVITIDSERQKQKEIGATVAAAPAREAEPEREPVAAGG